MPTRIRRPIGPAGRRRGVTLVEMLVVVALVVLMMTILVQIFQSATGAMSLSRTSTEMDSTLRQIESILRADLRGVTAKMTPPNNPEDNRGYFEYGENAFADAQGEDTDDYLAFTTRAADGNPFTGRQMIQKYTPSTGVPTSATITVAPITSQVAEVIYFLRNGNLYRRVLLVAPEQASSLVMNSSPNGGIQTSLFGSPLNVSWQGLNDISCHPAPVVQYSTTTPSYPMTPPVPNTLGDLTNRENRRFSPRFTNDYVFYNTTTATTTLRPDGLMDDLNFDSLPDYYPTIYYDGVGQTNGPNIWTHAAAFQNGLGRVSNASYDVFAFPYIFPGMYTFPANYNGPSRVGSMLGWSHCLAPSTADGTTSTPYVLNHAPLAVGDNLPSPAANQTWWGFPTWRETMSAIATSTVGGATVGWTDPVVMVATPGANLQQPLGLQFINPTAASALKNTNLLPPIATYGVPQPGTDTAAGSSSFIASPGNPRQVWEDDLLLTGVRSFDVKAYDPNAPLYNVPLNYTDPNYPPFSAGYQDLGYASAYYEKTGTAAAGLGNSVAGPNGAVTATYATGTVNNISYTFPTFAAAQTSVAWQGAGQEPVGFGHEGRIPPLPSDFRMHPRKPFLFDSTGGQYPYNIGDDHAGVIRLTRVWDSWSTAYTEAPDSDFSALTGYAPGLPAVYPSFPPPYPTALRGIQVQIRMTDARGERTKSITIRHDFTDKLH